MLTKENVHTFIVDTDGWKEGMPFRDIKVIHENCGNQSIHICENLPHLNASLNCFDCHTHSAFPDWSFLLTILEHRPIIYCSEGKIIRFFHESTCRNESPMILNKPCTIKIDEEGVTEPTIFFEHTKILHTCNECDDLLMPIFYKFDSLSVQCAYCCQQFDFNNLDLLVAVFNTKLFHATIEIKTESGNITVKTEIRKE